MCQKHFKMTILAILINYRKKSNSKLFEISQRQIRDKKAEKLYNDFTEGHAVNYKLL